MNNVAICSNTEAYCNLQSYLKGLMNFLKRFRGVYMQNTFGHQLFAICEICSMLVVRTNETRQLFHSHVQRQSPGNIL